MSRQRKSTFAKAGGYGYQHTKIRRAFLAVWIPGDPCIRCGLPMWGPASKINLGHNDDRSAYLGLEHESCNKSDGAKRGNALRSGTDGVRRSRKW
jgi:hypothetical protein